MKIYIEQQNGKIVVFGNEKSTIGVQAIGQHTFRNWEAGIIPLEWNSTYDQISVVSKMTLEYSALKEPRILDVTNIVTVKGNKVISNSTYKEYIIAKNNDEGVLEIHYNRNSKPDGEEYMVNKKVGFDSQDLVFDKESYDSDLKEWESETKIVPFTKESRRDDFFLHLNNKLGRRYYLANIHKGISSEEYLMVLPAATCKEPCGKCEGQYCEKVKLFAFFKDNYDETDAQKMISDSDMVEAFGNSDFGEQWSKRDILNNSVLKYSGYSTGHTAKCICIELGLYDEKKGLTKKGKEYLYAAYGKSM